MELSFFIFFLFNFLVITEVHAVITDESGFDVSGVLTADVFSNRSGGLTEGTSAFALLDLSVDADLEVLGGWSGALLHVGALWARGDDPSDDIGEFNALSNIVMPEGDRMFEVWLEKTFDGNRARFKFGMTTLDGDFQTSEYSGTFINSGFGIMPTISGNMPIPTFPQAALGSVLQYSATESSYVQLGIYDGDAGNHERGTRIDLDSAQGVAIAFEIGSEVGSELKGAYKIGALYHTGEFTDIRDGSMVDGNSTFYVIVDQMLTANDNGDPKLAGFFRIGHSPERERNSVSSYAELGMNLFMPFPGRENDLFGVAILYTDFSDDFINDLASAGNPVNETESVLEIFYQAEVTSWLVVKPDVQFIKDPLTSEDATVVGVRVEGAF
jgi:porin